MLRLRTALALSLAALALTAAGSGHAGGTTGNRTETFPYDDNRLLLPAHQGGGAVHMTPGVTIGASVPVVVFLHGLNPTGKLHMWIDGSPLDLRAAADGLVRDGSTPPFVVAAPSQTKDAESGRTLFRSFELTKFLDHVDQALSGHATVDRARVLVFAHSGAGCVPGGAALGIAKQAANGFPRAIALVDTCLRPTQATVLADVDLGTDVFVRYQRSTWRRDFLAFEATFLSVAPEARAASASFGGMAVTGPDAHDRIVPMALQEILPRVLGAGVATDRTRLAER